MAYADSVVGAESGGNPNSTNANSSASGPAGFTNGTWLDTIKAARPDLAQGQSDDALLALKTDPALSAQMADAYGAQNAGILAKAGLPVNDGTKYLAHFAGPQGAVGILNADPSAPAGSVLSAGAMKANPFLAKMTAGDVAAWANGKMGGSGMSPPMSIAGPRVAAVAPAAPAPQQPQAAPQQQQAPSGGVAPVNLAALAAVPGLQNILPQRANPFGLKVAPFSLRG